MGSKDKLIERFKKKPKDFTYEETLSLMAYLGYHEHTPPNHTAEGST